MPKKPNFNSLEAEAKVPMIRKICGVCHQLKLYTAEELKNPSIQPKLCQEKVRALTKRLSPQKKEKLSEHTFDELKVLVTIFLKYLVERTLPKIKNESKNDA